MAWRINTLKFPAMTQLGMNWGPTVGSLVIGIPVVWTVSRTSTHSDATVEDSKTYFGTDANKEERK